MCDPRIEVRERVRAHECVHVVGGIIENVERRGSECPRILWVAAVDDKCVEEVAEFGVLLGPENDRRSVRRHVFDPFVVANIGRVLLWMAMIVRVVEPRVKELAVLR